MFKSWRFIGCVITVFLSIAVVGFPRTVLAGTNDYEGYCLVFSAQRGECVHVVVLSKAYTDTHPNSSRAKFTCTRRSGSTCIGWVVANPGLDAGQVSTQLVVGTCVVKESDYTTELGVFGIPVLTYQSRLDRNCNGLLDIGDTRLPANKLLRVYPPMVGSSRRVWLVNLTMVNGQDAGYITAARCGAISAGPQSFSSGNHPMNTALANLAVLDVGHFQSPCIYNQLEVDLVVDLQGYFDEVYNLSPLGAPNSYELTLGQPRRLLDTRDPGLERPRANSVTRVVTDAPPGSGAALINLVMVGADSDGYVTAGPCDQIVPGAQSYSSGNHSAATAVSNLSFVRLGADGSFCIFNEKDVHLVVDLQGLFVQPSETTLGFEPAPSRRLIDTRNGAVAPIPEGSITTVQTSAPAGTSAVLVNLAMAMGEGNGFITADRCSALSPGSQTKSSANYPNQVPISNLSVVPIDPDGTFCVYNSTPVHLIADIQGYFQTAATLQLQLVAGTRLIDTRVNPQ